MKRLYSVWEFRSVDGKQVVRSVRVAYPDDGKYQHEYQRIVWRGEAESRADAENLSQMNGKES